MKKLKKIFCGLLALAMLFVTTACTDSSPKTAVLTREQDDTDCTFKVEAIGDEVHKITQTTTMDVSIYDELELLSLKTSLASYKLQYDLIPGTTYSYTEDGSELVETITIDCSDPDTMEKLDEEGLMPLTGDGDKVSYQLTIENLESDGWTLEEEY